ncbi:MAG: glutamyl-tRNA amidotransferase [Elusimicrobia bacterium RIFCSPLOWO2_01_FULL_59_12]|nr:MAG: glutamyl-tRNA amidotransferase [Elusimicrobia bacterium RIFCSPLOWO2_01_FULL_59_12]
MDLKTRLTDDLQAAMKQRETVKVSTLRMLIAAIRNKEIEKKKTFADGDVQEVIQSEAKSRRESVEQYRNGHRADLADKEESELKVLLAYLPEPMSESQLRELAQGALKEVGAKGPQDMGRVMSALMPKIKGRVDGKQAQQAVQQLLSATKA